MNTRWKIAALLAVLAIAAFFRFYQITTLPPGLYPDEATNGNNAVEAIHTGQWKLFYPENNGREGLFINIQALSIKLFGATPWALRLVSAVIGTLTILGMWLLTRELLGAEPGAWLASFLAAFFLATSYWHINFSRIGFRAIMIPFFTAFGFYWLLKSLRTGKISSGVLAGLSLGLGFHTYIAFRFVPFIIIVPILFALWAWRRERAGKPCVPCTIALILFVTFIVAIPIGIYFLQHPADFFGRGGQVSIFSAASPIREFVKSNILTLGMFNVWGDCNARHNFNCQPELFWPVGILFLFGIAFTLRDLFRKPLSPIPYTLSVWFLFMMFPATLTREGLPHALRSIGLIAPSMIFAAIGGARLWRLIARLVERTASNPKYAVYTAQLHRIKKELAVLAVLALVWVPLHTYNVYFVSFAEADGTYGAFAVDLWHEGVYLSKLPAGTRKIVVVNLSGDDIRGVPAPAQTIMFATDTFELDRRAANNFTYVKNVDDIVLAPKEHAIIIPMNGGDVAVLKALKARFPGMRVSAPGDFVAFEN